MKQILPFLIRLLVLTSPAGCYHVAPVELDDTDSHSLQDDSASSSTDIVTDTNSVFVCGTENIFGLWQWQLDVIGEESNIVTSEDVEQTQFIQFRQLPDDPYLAGSYAVLIDDVAEITGYFAFTTNAPDELSEDEVPLLLMWKEIEQDTNDTEGSIPVPSFVTEAVPIEIPDCETLVFSFFTETADGDEVVVKSVYVKVK